MCDNHQYLTDRESLLLSLEIGFRHLDLQRSWIEDLDLIKTEHHQALVNVVFESGDCEVVADLLHAWTVRGRSYETMCTLSGTCMKYLVNLHKLGPFSSRLRQLVIRSVELIGYEGFERVGVEIFVELLDHLHVTVEDMGGKYEWARLLLDIIQSPEGIQQLSHWYWELLVEVSRSWRGGVYNPQIAISLTEAEEWDKLERWTRIVWAAWPPEPGWRTEEDLEQLMIPLFHQRPDAVQKLGQWMEQWSKKWGEEVPESFERTCQRAWEAVQQDLRQVQLLAVIRCPSPHASSS